VLDNYGVSTRVYVARLSFGALMENGVAERTFRPLPRFPASTRDLALLADDALPVRAIEKAIIEAVGKILEQVTLFDVYRGKQIGEGKKSVAYSLTLRAADRTLTDEECDAAVGRVLKALSKIGVEIRQ
jgi:phenylalanyl-tRNA synthetase beta chain